MTWGITLGLGMVVWATGIVEGAGDVVGGDARGLALEHAAMRIAAAALRARSLCLMVSRELSHKGEGARNGPVTSWPACASSARETKFNCVEV
jgi:hypothetical protein